MIITTLDIETLTDHIPQRYIVEPIWPLQHTPVNNAVTTSPFWAAKNLFPPLASHYPCVICWLIFNSSGPMFQIKTYVYDEDNPDREETYLEDLGGDLADSDRVVTWNGRGFDMPLLNLRALKFGLPWEFWKRMCHRYSNYKMALKHYDLMDLLGDQGGARGIGLDGVCKLLGLPGKFDIHGSEVEAYFKEDPQRIVDYCVEDVWHTWLIYLRYAEVFLCKMPNDRDLVNEWREASFQFALESKHLERWAKEFGLKKPAPPTKQKELPF